jgi:hypothetical protein
MGGGELTGRCGNGKLEGMDLHRALIWQDKETGRWLGHNLETDNVTSGKTIEDVKENLVLIHRFYLSRAMLCLSPESIKEIERLGQEFDKHISSAEIQYVEVKVPLASVVLEKAPSVP